MNIKIKAHRGGVESEKTLLSRRRKLGKESYDLQKMFTSGGTETDFIYLFIFPYIPKNSLI